MTISDRLPEIQRRRNIRVKSFSLAANTTYFTVIYEKNRENPFRIADSRDHSSAADQDMEDNLLLSNSFILNSLVTFEQTRPLFATPILWTERILTSKKLLLDYKGAVASK